MHPRGVPMYLEGGGGHPRTDPLLRYRPGEWIPAAKDLAQEFGVSTITIRKALARLIRQGYLVSRQGTGTMVTLPELKKVEIHISGNFREWFEAASGRNPRLESEISEKVPFQAPQRTRTLLGARRDETVGRLTRLRRCQGRIVSYFINYFGAEHLRRLPRGKLPKRPFVEVFQDPPASA
jgi:DNA-binding GntR family transcriptional regulator